MEGEKLEVEFGEGEACITGVVLRGHDVFVPEYGFVGVEWHLVDGFQLRKAPLVRGGYDLFEEYAVVRRNEQSFLQKHKS